MTAASDAELLRLHVRHSSQEAFAALVARHLGLVHAAALRQVRSPDLARDVAQAVFIELARDAGRLRPDCVLPAWLHTATRHRAIDLIRGEARRKRREKIACASALDPAGRLGTNTMDSDLSSRLDEALSRLPAADREALILRFFSGKSLREIGQGLGLSDDAAQKRVERALERLRSVLRVGGAGGSVLSLGAWLSAQAAPVAPAGLAPSIAATALSANAALASGALTTTLLMTTAQKILAAAGLALLAGLGADQHRKTQNLRNELAALVENQTRETRTWSDRLSSLEAENLRLRAEADSSKAAPHEISNDAVDPVVAMMLAWVERLQNLKDHLAAHPEATTPEMSLLKDEDWLDAAKAEVKTARDYDKASAKLRSKADVLFHEHIKSALQNFARQTGSEFPADIAQLAPYFENPIDPRMLERWTILRESEIEGLRLNRPDGKVVTQKVCIDPRFENRLVFDASRTTSAMFSKAFTGVHAKLSYLYKTANAGREPETLDDLLPYATTPSERTIIERRGAP